MFGCVVLPQRDYSINQNGCNLRHSVHLAHPQGFKRDLPWNNYTKMQYANELFRSAWLAQFVKAQDCGAGGHGFKSWPDQHSGKRTCCVWYLWMVRPLHDCLQWITQSNGRVSNLGVEDQWGRNAKFREWITHISRIKWKETCDKNWTNSGLILLVRNDS